MPLKIMMLVKLRNTIRRKFKIDILNDSNLNNNLIFFFEILYRTGEVIMEIEMPIPQVTDVAFGGPNLDILYVTTGNRDGKQPEG